MSQTPTCGCCLRPFREHCRCHENESCPRCGACVEHCRCGGFTRKFEAVPEPRASCEGCRFWKRLRGVLGQCRRQAPCWPATFAHEWCGEFDSRSHAPRGNALQGTLSVPSVTTRDAERRGKDVPTQSVGTRS